MQYFLKIILLSFLLSYFNCAFQTNIFSQINNDKSGKNVIISPLSIYQVLSLLSNGAKESTLSEMLSVLGSTSLDELNDINYKILSKISSFSTIDIANAVMTRFKPLENFCSVADKYLAPMESLESVEQINEWCKEKTHGKIEKIIEQLSPETIMILLNAVYFKGEWINQFDKYFTKKLPFYNLSKNEIKVDTMLQIDHFRYFSNKEIQAIELPFQKDFMSAIIILPSEKIEINSFIKNNLAKKNYLTDIINKLDYAKVHLELPKFEVTFEETLNHVIKKLGMKKIFNSLEADLSGLYNRKGLFVSQVIHKTYLKVNEEGTEAAAVTLVAVDEASMAGEEEIIHEMKVNRPFLFLLKNWELPEGYDMVFMAKIEEI